MIVLLFVWLILLVIILFVADFVWLINRKVVICFCFLLGSLYYCLRMDLFEGFLFLVGDVEVFGEG